MTDEDSVRHTPWLVYSREHNAWWRTNNSGYTNDITQAGRYTRDDAKACCNQRDQQSDGSPSEVAVIAPEAEVKFLEKLFEVHRDYKAAYKSYISARDRADAAEARLQRIAGIIETVDARPIDGDESQTSADNITLPELQEIYALAKLDRPVVEPLLEEARKPQPGRKP